MREEIKREELATNKHEKGHEEEKGKLNMRRILSDSPKGIKYEVIGQLTRATINATDDYEPFAFIPYQAYYCPVCGEDAGIERQIAVILALEFVNGEKRNFVAWSHRNCLEKCVEINELDADLE